MALAIANTMHVISQVVLLFVTLVLATITVGEPSRASNRAGSGERRAWMGECPACPSCPACPALVLYPKGGRNTTGASPRPPPGATADLPRRRIPFGYKLHGSLGYYKIHYERRDWYAAKAICECEGGYLVVLNSQSEADLATSFMAKYNLRGWLHVGFFDETERGKYVTVLGGPLLSTGYAVWAHGEPSSVGWENCGNFLPYYGLNDVLCDAEMPFLCEFSV